MQIVLSVKKLILIAAIACVVLLGIFFGYRAALQQPQGDGNTGNTENTEKTDNDSGFKIGYATEGVTVVEDPNALQNAVDEMLKKAEEGQIALEFQNTATSNDGVNFDLYFANSELNSYDMFIAVYGDSEFKDQLFLSGLLRPGTAFKTIKLDRALEPGTHTVYVAYTQIEPDLETIHGQIIVTMEFVVK